MFAYLLAEFLVCQFINSSINGCEEFETLLILFFLKLHDFRYSYQSCISYYFHVSPGMLSLDALTYTMLSLVTLLISPSCHVIT